MGLTYSSVVDTGRDEVFSWHTRPGAIARLTPPWQPVTVLREAGSLRDGRAILGLPGGLRWVAAHRPDGYDPPNSFADELASLPLPWRHTHEFSPAGEAATLVTDVVQTPLPARVLRSMFVYRHRQLAGADAVIHLAGASIGGRFTAERKDEIRASRILPTRKLAEVAATGGLRAFVTASAIGIYGPDRGEEILTEASFRGDGFLADVVAGWEDAAAPAAAAGIRTVQVRTGIVQTPRGGMLRLLSPLFAAGLGGRLGTGKQWLAWIALDDLLDIYRRAVLDPGLSGPVNAVAPEPARNADYTRTLAAVLHRPAVLPVPGLGPRLLLGAEGAREIAQASQYVRPERLLGAGHQFRQPELTGALRHLFGRDGA